MQRSCKFAQVDQLKTNTLVVQSERDSIAATRPYRPKQESTTKPTLFAYERRAVAIGELSPRTGVINTAQLNTNNSVLTDTEQSNFVHEKASG